jgi:hypothetical protein
MGKVWDFLKNKGLDIGKAVADVATGGRASEAVDAVGSLLGIDVGTEDELLGALKSNPELVQKLKKQEAELKVRLHEIAMKDRKSARRREIKTGDSWTPRILAVIILLAFVATIVFLWQNAQSGIDPTVQSLFARTQGIIEGAVMTMLAYYFGSSQEADEGNRSMRETLGLGKSKEGS